MEHPPNALRLRTGYVRDAAVTLIAAIVAFLALDDITTDSAPTFALERVALAGCAAWFAIVAWRLLHRGHRVLSVISLALIAVGALAQRAIGPGTGPGLRFEYIATVAGLVWFVVLAGILAGLAWRAAGSYAA